MQGRGICLTMLLACAVGCEPVEYQPATLQPDPAPMGEGFDPASSGTIRGTVCWEGERPDVPALRAHLQPQGPPPLAPARLWPNPHAPRISPAGEVEGVVVFLRHVDPVRSRPWNHPPVRIEQRARQYVIHQGGRASGTGIVRCGDAVTMESTDDALYSLHARGAEYFSLRFVEPGKPVQRVLKHPGHVELSSGLGCIWMRAHLFVAEHPYYAVTDAAGCFVLSDVPAGSYEMICWVPNYRETERDLDPNTALPVRLTFGAPVRKSRVLTILPRTTATVPFTLSGRDFSPPTSR